jgi:hypothetical protein
VPKAPDIDGVRHFLPTEPFHQPGEHRLKRDAMERIVGGRSGRIHFRTGYLVILACAQAISRTMSIESANLIRYCQLIPYK